MVSKNFQVSDKVSYTGVFKGNFNDYNINHKLRYKFNKNVSLDFKAVDFILK